MKKIAKLISLSICTLFLCTAYANQDCIKGYESSRFIFAFSDGDTHLLTFKTNKYSVTTGEFLDSWYLS